jgi:hypothetical protein
MSDETRSALSQAFDAIEAGDLESARAILQPILAVDSDNPDAWWIYSHAVTDPQEALAALENVVRIDPQYPGAAELLGTLRERLPRRPAVAPPPPPTTVPDMPGDEPDFGDDLDKTPARGMEPVTEEAEESRRGILPILAAALLVVVIVALIASLLSQQGQSPAATPTQVALGETSVPFSAPTEEASPLALVTEEPSPTESVTVPTAVFPPTVAPTGETPSATDEFPAATAEGVSTPVEATEEAALSGTETGSVQPTEAEQALLAGLRRYTLADEPLTREATTLGETVLVNVCVSDRREVAPALRPVMRAVANGTQALGAEVAAVGARLMDCATGRAFVVMAAERQSAEAHAAGTLSYVEFRESWQPQR